MVYSDGCFDALGRSGQDGRLGKYRLGDRVPDPEMYPDILSPRALPIVAATFAEFTAKLGI